MKIFIGITEVSGYYSRLCTGFKNLGIPYFYAQLYGNKHNYNILKTDNWLTVRCRNIFQKQAAGYNDILYKVTGNIYKFLVFIWAIIHFDVFIFTGMESFYNGRELWVYKLLNKKIVFICLGTATRLPYADGTFINGIYTHVKPKVDDYVYETKKKFDYIKKIEKYTDIFINLPAQAQLNSKPFISSCYLGLPFIFKNDRNIETNEATDNKTIRILHAASYIGCRGTKEFKTIIDELLCEGYNIEYRSISGVSNEKVMENIQWCDFVLDELYSDMPMATFALEAASLKKPTLVCGYLASAYKKYYTDDMLPPSLFILPNEMKKGIIKLIEDKQYREELGKNAYEFVRKNYDCTLYAKKVIRIIKGNCPKKWWINPFDINYRNGYGVSENQQKDIVKSIVNKYGEEGLGLDFNPNLKAAFLEYVYNRE